MQSDPSISGEIPMAVMARAFGELGDAAQDISDQIAASFSQTLRKIVTRQLEEGPAADQALLDGGLVVNDRTVVMRLNPQTCFVEFFCDVGQLDSFSLEEAYRLALEANLCRKFPGVILGVHPESGRMVATLAMSGLMADNAELCMTILENLTQAAWQVRESGLFRFED